MPWEAWYTVGVIVMVVLTMATVRINVDTAMVGGLALLIIGDAVLPGTILPWEQGIAGYAHQAIILIAGLFVIAGALQATGGFDMIAQRLLGRPRTIAGAQLRLMVPVAIMSGFMNNTPIVAMYLPIVGDWAKKLRVSASKLYMPLSFAAIMGGKLTLIGTYSNIVVMGLYQDFHAVEVARETAAEASVQPWLTALGIEALSPQMIFWGVALVGIPTGIAGILAIAALSRWLLPARRPATRSGPDARRYQVEMQIEPGSPIVGKSIEEAGLRHLPGLYLTQIERDGIVIPAVSPQKELQAGDRLAFAGILESVVDLRKIRGLVPATNQVDKVDSGRETRTLVEAVIAAGSPLVGQTVRASQFRTKYNAAIIAVHRSGERLRRKLGDIELRPGDTLLLETHTGFVSAFRDGQDFYLVSQVEGSRPIRHERAGHALGVLVLLVALMTLTPLHPVVVVLMCAGLMVGLRCISGTEARNAVNWQVLLVIGAALGMGEALNTTGAAHAIAGGLLDVFHGVGPRTMLFILFMITALFAQLIGNGGAATLMFPIMMGMAAELPRSATEIGVNPEPFVFTLMIAAGSTFLSPVSYQTNLMVYGPGGYRFLDFGRLGLPLTLIIALLCTLLAPMYFPFVPA